MPKNNQEGRIYNILGIISILSTIILPVYAGIPAIIFGFIGLRKGDDKFGKVVIGLGILFALMSVFILLSSGFLEQGNVINMDVSSEGLEEIYNC